MTTKDHYVGETFLNALEQEAGRIGWCRDIFLRDDLFIAVRRDHLNVYHRGASIFLIEMRKGKLSAKTHAKYLTRAEGSYVSIGSDGRFVKSSPVLWDRYEGPETLDEMIRASRAYGGPEKSGLHPLIMSDPNVVDVEVALTRKAEDAAAEASVSPAEPVATASRMDRIDAAVLAKRQSAYWVVFHEAKHFSNSALRAGPGRAPAVVKQIDDYRRAIERHRPSLEERYRNACASLARIADLRDLIRTEAGLPAIGAGENFRAASATGVRIDPTPRLVIFGFDKAQRDDPAWGRHLERLEEAIGCKVRAIGNPKSRPARFAVTKHAAE